MKMGEQAEARRLYEEVMAGRTVQLGPAHLDTLRTKGSLAILLKEMGERVEARRMYEGPAQPDCVVGNVSYLPRAEIGCCQHGCHYTI